MTLVNPFSSVIALTSAMSNFSMNERVTDALMSKLKKPHSQTLSELAEAREKFQEMYRKARQDEPQLTEEIYIDRLKSFLSVARNFT